MWITTVTIDLTQFHATLTLWVSRCKCCDIYTEKALQIHLRGRNETLPSLFMNKIEQIFHPKFLYGRQLLSAKPVFDEKLCIFKHYLTFNFQVLPHLSQYLSLTEPLNELQELLFSQHIVISNKFKRLRLRSAIVILLAKRSRSPIFHIWIVYK